MQDWIYTFDAVDKKTWIAQIEKDLRGKSPDSLLREWWPGETLQPVIHRADAQDSVVRLPDALFANPPSIIEYIDTSKSTPDAIHVQIMGALNYGAEVLLLHCASLKNNPLDQWLDGVHLDMVEVHIQPDSLAEASDESLIKFLEKGIKIRIERSIETSAEKDIAAYAEKVNTHINALRFVYKIPGAGKWDTTTQQVLNMMLEDLKAWTNSGRSKTDFFNQTVLVLESDAAYFKHIIQTRVLHLIWMNLLRHLEINQGQNDVSWLETHIRDLHGDNPDQYLIRASAISLATSLCGSHGLCINPANKENTAEFYSRTNRNIHHLLNLESGMYRGTDPLAGAYALDLVTRSWTSRIWDGLRIEK